MAGEDKNKFKQTSQKKKKTEEERQHYLITSDQVIHRLQWDLEWSSLQSSVIIGYMDRFLGMQEIGFTAFLAQTDIPMHRIYYFAVPFEKRFYVQNEEGEMEEQIQIENIKFWDRDTRTDLFSDKQIFDILKEKQEIQVKENSSVTNSENKVVFLLHKKRKHFQDYTPEDDLEKYLLEQNHSQLALDHPTHISQLGGTYHCQDEEAILQHWKMTLQKQQDFYMEEFRSQIFSLYLDLDFKLNSSNPIDITSNGWLSSISQFTQRYFSVSQLYYLVTECHGVWNDTVNTDAVFKSGFRIYFPTIFVDEEIMIQFYEQLASHLNTLYPNGYENQINDWKMENIVDVESCLHERVRMFGSCKFKRGINNGRKYHRCRFFNCFGEDENVMQRLCLPDEKVMLMLLTTRTGIRIVPMSDNTVELGEQFPKGIYQLVTILNESVDCVVKTGKYHLKKKIEVN